MQFIFKHKIAITVIVVTLILLSFLVFGLTNDNKVLAEEIVKEEKEKDLDNNMEASKLVIVDVKGAVNNPGVYRVNEGSLVDDIIKLAGGLTDKGDTSIINLSKKLINEMVIIVPSKEEIENLKSNQYYLGLKQEDIDKYLKKTYDELIKNSLQVIIDNKIVENEIDSNLNQDSSTKKISLNSGTLEELQLIPGIGEAKAQEIINYRNINGAFTKIEDIKNIKGIGDATFEKLKDFITV